MHVVPLGASVEDPIHAAHTPYGFTNWPAVVHMHVLLLCHVKLLFVQTHPSSMELGFDPETQAVHPVPLMYEVLEQVQVLFVCHVRFVLVHRQVVPLFCSVDPEVQATQVPAETFKNEFAAVHMQVLLTYHVC
jgi:hypothetical protein